MGHGGASWLREPNLTLLANFHAGSTRYLLSWSNCFPPAEDANDDNDDDYDYHGRHCRGIQDATKEKEKKEEEEDMEKGGEGAAGNPLQDYLRYGRGHLCRNKTSASSAQPNFGNSLYALVDANSYPLVFPAGNLAQPVISWHISALSVSLSLSFGWQTILLPLILCTVYDPVTYHDRNEIGHVKIYVDIKFYVNKP